MNTDVGVLVPAASYAPIFPFDPIEDVRWRDLVNSCGGSVVHSNGWLNPLKHTFGYEPVGYTTSPPTAARLENGIVLCRVTSWLTGRRLVSLPFTDHCDLLLRDLSDGPRLLLGLQAVAASENLDYIEVRARESRHLQNESWQESSSYAFHTLDLRPSLDALFRATHKTSKQQMIRRAERELTYEEGRTEVLLSEFYRLMLLTRRRHKLPPQPIQWFRNLITYMGDRVKIRRASKQGETVACILTLHGDDTVVYKYGCSDSRFHNLGGMPYLLWKAIQDGKANGAVRLDFGRSDLDNPGLIAFKDRWGAERCALTYLRYSIRSSRPVTASHGMRLAKHLFARMPDPVLTAAGRLAYRHLG
jgi:hypothetical protein